MKQWLKLGDANTRYFFGRMKNRVAQNAVTTCTTVAGMIVRSQKDI